MISKSEDRPKYVFPAEKVLLSGTFQPKVTAESVQYLIVFAMFKMKTADLRYCLVNSLCLINRRLSMKNYKQIIIQLLNRCREMLKTYRDIKIRKQGTCS
ncbi:MAG: hypothetical protein EZS28_001085 [Streblomastix strix]|uniref:Uncharacterized protein n=1 Tax=Streblomastix strix TaxID=222440 RepID=A0A5J4X819_9EUKA|nr:MAG: hypothetical protein EZS28_001085 [Streblomastix strix]